MPLNIVDKGVSYTLERVTGPDDVRHYLESLGFVDNVELVVLSEVNGNFVVSLKGSRIAIGKELAKRIIVGWYFYCLRF